MPALRFLTNSQSVSQVVRVLGPCSWKWYFKFHWWQRESEWVPESNLGLISVGKWNMFLIYLLLLLPRKNCSRWCSFFTFQQMTEWLAPSKEKSFWMWKAEHDLRVSGEMVNGWCMVWHRGTVRVFVFSSNGSVMQNRVKVYLGQHWWSSECYKTISVQSRESPM